MTHKTEDDEPIGKNLSRIEFTACSLHCFEGLVPRTVYVDLAKDGTAQALIGAMRSLRGVNATFTASSVLKAQYASRHSRGNSQ